jgi:hypothetical protein
VSDCKLLGNHAFRGLIRMNLENIVSTSLWAIIPLGILGSLLHFLFDWTRHNKFIGLIAAVNESYWEHIKIAVWPVLLLHLGLFIAGGFQFSSFIPAATISLYSIPISMIGLVYLYKAVSKRNILWIDISVFFLVIAISQVVFALLLQELDSSFATILISTAFLVGLVVAFLRFTARPPREPDVFIDPTNKKYGLRAHPDMDPTSGS